MSLRLIILKMSLRILKFSIDINNIKVYINIIEVQDDFRKLLIWTIIYQNG